MTTQSSDFQLGWPGNAVLVGMVPLAATVRVAI
jgi:hypothetical protein